MGSRQGVPTPPAGCTSGSGAVYLGAGEVYLVPELVQF